MTVTPAGTAHPTPRGTAEPTPCHQIVPPLNAPLTQQNGNLDLGVRFTLGSVRFFLAACQTPDTVRAKYGLGALSRVLPDNTTDELRTRYYRAAVPVGNEADYVVRLAAHPEDIQYAEFDVVPHPCLSGGQPTPPPCWIGSSVSPRVGPAGTSYAMTICCWPSGTHVTKIFTTPSGKTIVLDDVAGKYETVPAGWGGSANDERGTYTVFVRDDSIGALVRFTID